MPEVLSLVYASDVDAVQALYDVLAPRFADADGPYTPNYPATIGVNLKGDGNWQRYPGGDPMVVLGIDDGRADDAWQDSDGNWRIVRVNVEVQAMDINGATPGSNDATAGTSAGSIDLDPVDSSLARDLEMECRANYQTYWDRGLLDIRCISNRHTAGENQQGLAALLSRRPHQIVFRYEQGEA